MARSKKKKAEVEADLADERSAYAATPLWDKYYREMRRRIRFPRYYKKALNW